MTSAAAGVRFDFGADGQLVQIAWTDPAFHNAWLALDRNNNGQIDNATELFGNLTEQPPSGNPNGYLALAEFDKTENGGNGNGRIDPGDAIYPKLLLWIDSNHNGMSEPNELHHLSDFGIVAIDLAYRGNPYTDPYGNQFRYQSRIWDAKGLSVDKLTFDVFLVQN